MRQLTSSRSFRSVLAIYDAVTAACSHSLHLLQQIVQAAPAPSRSTVFAIFHSAQVEQRACFAFFCFIIGRYRFIYIAPHSQAIPFILPSKQTSSPRNIAAGSLFLLGPIYWLVVGRAAVAGGRPASGSVRPSVFLHPQPPPPFWPRNPALFSRSASS